MFIRNERSIKEFIRFYPFVSTLIIINIIIWLLYFLQFSLGHSIYNFGIGQNLSIHDGQYWRLITPIFFLVGLVMFAFNSFSFFFFGLPLVKFWGKVIFFFACCV